ncbi:MAG: hypothetical protein A2Y12_02080 [Planctomycetes bacterium GWF2_42_9]|nr:MAG: hypothetical protein A2Y12_02080 [Planctomycetes bacterium GWF2_42_9]
MRKLVVLLMLLGATSMSIAVPVTNGLLVSLDSTQGVTTSGTAVTAWADSVGGNTFLQATASRQPALITATLNGVSQNVISFTGGTGGDVLAQQSTSSNLNSNPAPSAFTWYVVWNPTVVSTSQRIFAENATINGGTTTTNFGIGTNGTVLARTNSGTTSATAVLSTPPTVGVWYVSVGSWDMTTGIAKTVLYDFATGNLLEQATITGANGILNNGGFASFLIGGSSTSAGSNFGSFMIADLLVYNRVLTTAENTQVVSSLIPEPATITILALGAAALLKRRK